MIATILGTGAGWPEVLLTAAVAALLVVLSHLLLETMVRLRGYSLDSQRLANDKICREIEVKRYELEMQVRQEQQAAKEAQILGKKK